ncbi:response regulator transcription factor [Flammeovirgaceae bacterium SG7u.111]|nr:response regulator transcription factor [Flammeovirgaceae bacterium SG7u.132]WPO32993.1 response regulator transcription factor [Flammeovirgaceae bacterium SG7u.111]
MIKILIADDHQLFRDGIISLLSSVETFEVLGGVSNGKELLDELRAGKMPHVVLLDLGMPVMDGFEVLKIAKKEFPKIKFIAISMHDDGQYVVKCVRSGAFGYLLKNADKEELIEAIETVVDGHKYFNRRITELMINNMAVEGTQIKKLSERESEILEMVSDGKTTKEIADELCVSTRTVETHRVNMMKKLAVTNTAELIKKAAHLGLI